MTQSKHDKTARTTLHRLPDRGTYDHETIHAILDEAYVGHLGVQTDEGPIVIPVAFGRDGDEVYFHGSAKSRLFESLAKGSPACFTVTHRDGLVLAKSAFHHSMNYRSVMVFGVAKEIVEEEAKHKALNCILEHLIPGRAKDARPTSEGELKATRIVSLSLKESSAKVRKGPPEDSPEDQKLPVWSGLIPLETTQGELIPSEESSTPIPEYLKKSSL